MLLLLSIADDIDDDDDDVIVRRPPSITLGPSGQQVTKMGGSPVTIPCEASGTPQPTE